MLKIVIPPFELYDEVKEEFIVGKTATELSMEHSLVSLSKWESKWRKPFLEQKNMTPAETIEYIACMTITQNVDPKVYLGINNEIIDIVNNYIDEPMTATIISKQKNQARKQIITAEIIYYWMITLNIPFECQKWHLNRLLMLISVCDIKNGPQKKMGRREILQSNAAINAQRRAELGTRG